MTTQLIKQDRLNLLQLQKRYKMKMKTNMDNKPQQEELEEDLLPDDIGAEQEQVEEEFDE